MSTNVNALRLALANRTIAVGDAFFVPSLFPGIPGVTQFECQALSPKVATFNVSFNGVYLCRVQANYSPTPILERLP